MNNEKTRSLGKQDIPVTDFRRSIVWVLPPKVEGYQYVEEGPLVTCVAYLFPGNELEDLQFAGRFFKSIPPRAGGYALYYDKGELLHVGRVVENNLILSKWGWTGGVHIHPASVVPAVFGTEIQYKESTKLGSGILNVLKYSRALRDKVASCLPKRVCAQDDDE